jgi:hypothetical protein
MGILIGISYLVKRAYKKPSFVKVLERYMKIRLPGKKKKRFYTGKTVILRKSLFYILAQHLVSLPL